MLICAPKFVGAYSNAQTHYEEIELKCHNFAGDGALLLGRCSASRLLPSSLHHCLDLKFGLERVRPTVCERLSITDETLAQDGSSPVEELEEACEVKPSQEEESQRLATSGGDKLQQLEVIVERPKVEEPTRLEQLRASLTRLTLTRRRETKIKLRASRSPKEAMISYCHGEASEQAQQLKAALERLGVSTYLDLDEIKSGEDWQDSLNEAVLQCRCLVALVTPSYGETLWTSRELKLADLVGKLIIPVNFGQRWPPPSLAIQFASRQYVEWPPNGRKDVSAPVPECKKGLLRWPRRKGWQRRKQLKQRQCELWNMELLDGAEPHLRVAHQIKMSLDELNPRNLSQAYKEGHGPSGRDSPPDSAIGTSEESAESVAAGDSDGRGRIRWHLRLWHSAGHRFLHRLTWRGSQRVNESPKTK